MSNSVLRDYLNLKISKLAENGIHEAKLKSEILVQDYLKISKADLYLENIKVSEKDIKVMDKIFLELFKNKQIQKEVEQAKLENQ